MKQIGTIASRTHPWTMEKVTLGRYRALMQLFTFSQHTAGDPDVDDERWKRKSAAWRYSLWTCFPLSGVYPKTFSGILFCKGTQTYPQIGSMVNGFSLRSRGPKHMLWWKSWKFQIRNSEIIWFRCFPKKVALRLWHFQADSPQFGRGTEIAKLKHIISYIYICIHDQPKSWQVQCIMFVFLMTHNNLKDRTGGWPALNNQIKPA